MAPQGHCHCLISCLTFCSVLVNNYLNSVSPYCHYHCSCKYGVAREACPPCQVLGVSIWGHVPWHKLLKNDDGLTNDV